MAHDPAEVADILRKKAMLLLHREQELFQFRQERQRISTWLEVFHSMALLPSWEGGALARRWAALLVERLGIQVAGVYSRQAGEPWALEAGEPSPKLCASMRIGAEAAEFLRAHPTGHYLRSPAFAPIEELSERTGLANFLWLHVSVEDRARLLVAGFSEEAAPVQ